MHIGHKISDIIAIVNRLIYRPLVVIALISHTNTTLLLITRTMILSIGIGEYQFNDKLDLALLSMNCESFPQHMCGSKRSLVYS